jgi:hypothetical protein
MPSIYSYPPEVQKQLVDRIMKDWPDAMNSMVFRAPGASGLWDYKKTTFDYLAPELRRAGMLPDAPWVVPAAAAITEMFKSNNRTAEEEADVLNTAVLMAVSHPYGYDTIKSAPILVLAFRHFRGANPKTTKGRQHMVACWVAFMREKLKLRELMSRLDAPYGLRILHPKALCSRHMRTYSDIGAHLSPSEIAQVVPPTAEEQRGWVDTIKGFVQRTAARDRVVTGPRAKLHFKWAMKNLGLVGESVAGDLADFIFTHRETFNEEWTLKRVLHEQQRWHDRLAKQQDAGAFEREHGIPFDKSLIKDDGAPLTFRVRLDWAGEDYTFHRICSAMELYAEGRAMHHCVGTYTRSMVDGTSAFYSMRDNKGDRKATIQYTRGDRRRFQVFDPGAWTGLPAPDFSSPISMTMTEKTVYEWRVGQAKMLCNGKLTPELEVVLSAFSNVLKDPRPPGEEITGFRYERQAYMDDLAEQKRNASMTGLLYARELGAALRNNNHLIRGLRDRV